MSTDDIVREILVKGELQVGEKERGAKLDQLHAEVISIVASKCVDPGSKRVYTPSMVEKALAELATQPEGGWHGVKESKSAKAQALEAIKALVAAQIIPIARARMRLRITGNKKCKEKVMEQVEQVEEEEFTVSGDWECVGFVEPGKYKTLVDIVGAETKGRGRVEILDTAVSRFSEDGAVTARMCWLMRCRRS
jgi:ribosome maturation protein SDO1